MIKRVVFIYRIRYDNYLFNSLALYKQKMSSGNGIMSGNEIINYF